MRTPPNSRSGAVQPRLVIIVVVLAVGLGILVIRSRRPAPTPIAEKPAVPMELARTNLVLEAGRLHAVGVTAPFTGFMLEHYHDGALRSRSAISNGVLNGLSQGWYTNAQRQVEEHFKEGVSHGLRTKWYPDGTKQSEADIADGKLQGVFKKWHENGTLSDQAEFVADKPEGVSFSYFPSGFLKARVVLKDGKVVEQTFWKDGEKKP